MSYSGDLGAHLESKTSQVLHGVEIRQTLRQVVPYKLEWFMGGSPERRKS